MPGKAARKGRLLRRAAEDAALTPAIPRLTHAGTFHHQPHITSSCKGAEASDVQAMQPGHLACTRSHLWRDASKIRREYRGSGSKNRGGQTCAWGESVTRDRLATTGTFSSHRFYCFLINQATGYTCLVPPKNLLQVCHSAACPRLDSSLCIERPFRPVGIQ